MLSRCLSCDELVEMMCSSHLTLDPSDLLACLTFIFQFNTKLKLMVGWIPLNLEPTDQPTATSSFSSSLPSLTHITSFFISTNSPPHTGSRNTRRRPSTLRLHLPLQRTPPPRLPLRHSYHPLQLSRSGKDSRIIPREERFCKVLCESGGATAVVAGDYAGA